MESFSAEGDAGSVVVRGEIDMDTAPVLRAAIERALLGSNGEVSIDLGGVSFMDSSGINELLRPVNAGNKVVVTAVSTAVRRTCRLVGLDQVLGFPADPESVPTESS